MQVPEITPARYWVIVFPLSLMNNEKDWPEVPTALDLQIPELEAVAVTSVHVAGDVAFVCQITVTFELVVTVNVK